MIPSYASSNPLGLATHAPNPETVVAHEKLPVFRGVACRIRGADWRPAQTAILDPYHLTSPSNLNKAAGQPFAGLTDHHLTAAGMVGLAAARRGVQYLGQRSDLARNNLLADYFSASGPNAFPPSR